MSDKNQIVVVSKPLNKAQAEPKLEVIGGDVHLPPAKIVNTVPELINLGQIAPVKAAITEVGAGNVSSTSLATIPVPEVRIDEVIRPGATSESVDAGVMGKLPDNLRSQLGDIAAKLQASGVSPVFEGGAPWRR